MERKENSKIDLNVIDSSLEKDHRQSDGETTVTVTNGTR